MVLARTLWRNTHARPQRANVRTFFPEAKPKVPKPEVAPGAISEAAAEAAAPVIAEPVKKARLHRRVLDHWKNFWLGIKTDYTEAMLDFKKDAQAKPVKSAILGAFAGFLLYCNQRNPDERSFHQNFMENGLELSQVGDGIRNPRSQRLQDYVVKADNAGLLRRLNLGVASVMWVDDHFDGLGVFAAQCDLLQPSYLDIRHRVIDIGFLGKWWLSSRIMTDFDVNEEEWKEDGSPVLAGLRPMR